MALQKLIDALPVAGTNPFAFVSYALLLGAVVYYLVKRSDSNERLRVFEMLPADDKLAALRNLGIPADEYAQLPREKKLKYLMARNVFVTRLCIIVATLLFLVIVVVQAAKANTVRSMEYLRQGIAFEEQLSDYVKAVDMYRSAHLLKPSSKALARIARCLLVIGPPSAAQGFIEEAARESFSNPEEFVDKADILRLLAVVKRRNGDGSAALTHLKQAEEAIGALRSKDAIRILAKIYNQRGNLLMQTQKFSDAEAAFVKAIEFDRLAFDSKAEVQDLGNLASLYSQIDKKPEAAKILSEGIASFRGTSDPNWLAALLYKRARVYEGDYNERARKDYLEAIAIIGRLDTPDYVIQSRIRGDYAQFVVQTSEQKLDAYPHALMALQDSFKTRDAHAILAQTDGLFQYFVSLQDEKSEVTFGLTAYQLALRFAQGDELKDVKERIASRDINRKARNHFPNEAFEPLCEMLFGYTGIVSDSWKQYLLPFSIADIRVN